jgi:hypothetical protein
MNDRSNRASALTAGGVLILVGALFLARNLTHWRLGDWNWWALFILIPAVGALASAWRSYQAAGHLSAEARGPLVFGVGLLFVAGVFLLDLSWGTLWPFFLIIAGAGMLVAR